MYLDKQGAINTPKSPFTIIQPAASSGTLGQHCVPFRTKLDQLTGVYTYSIDDFAWHDIPDTINHILQVTGAPQLSYIGFSQGTAQAFAALSVQPQLNAKINVFIALAPAMSPAGLAAPIVDGLMKAS